MVVVDASLIVGAVSPDEVSPDALPRIGAAFERGAIAPSLFAYEVANVLILKERRGSLSRADRERTSDDIAALPITIRPLDPDRVRREVAALASRAKLTVYDAAYLDLAIETGAALATLDLRLAAAARTEGVPLL